MIKVAMIGAGSVVFSKNLTGDILGYPEFRSATMSYMDIDPERLEVGTALCRKVAQALEATPKIESTFERRQALAGADFVINMVQIGGFDSTLVDFEIPRKYGLNFTIADTTGPAGLFRALRTYPMLSGLCRDMEDLCPKAVLLNYSNPMSMNMQTVYRTSGVRGVGLCHSVQGTFSQLMHYIGEDPRQVAFTAAGINHMAFFLKLQKNGQDLYPRLFEAMKNPAIYSSNRVRFEIMKRLGCFVTESSEHNAEYCPWFIPRGREIITRYSVPIDEYLRRCDSSIDEFEHNREVSRSDKPIEVVRSHEYGSLIIHAMVSGQPAVVYGNMPNRGAITNLPSTAIVEAPTLVDRSGPAFAGVGELPPQLVAYIQPHISQHELFIRAAMEGRRDCIYQAAMFDPLTSATLTLDQIVEMCDELIAAHGKLLPDVDAKKTLVPASGKTFGPVDAAELRRRWDKAQEAAVAEYVKECHVIGAFRPAKREELSLDYMTPVDADFAGRGDGSVDLNATYAAGGQVLKWMPAQSDRRRGQFDFGKLLGVIEFSVGYAYFEVREKRARKVMLRLGSDDGIRVWLNGERVFEHEVGRAYTPDADVFEAQLTAGVNRFFIKLDNYRNGWGFGIGIPADSDVQR